MLVHRLRRWPNITVTFGGWISLGLRPGQFASVEWIPLTGDALRDQPGHTQVLVNSSERLHDQRPRGVHQPWGDAPALPALMKTETKEHPQRDERRSSSVIWALPFAQGLSQLLLLQFLIIYNGKCSSKIWTFLFWCMEWCDALSLKFRVRTLFISSTSCRLGVKRTARLLFNICLDREVDGDLRVLLYIK